MVYLTTLSAAEATYRRVERLILNNELTRPWKEENRCLIRGTILVSNGTDWEKPRKTSVSQESQFPGAN
jgi:hypothetical protein